MKNNLLKLFKEAKENYRAIGQFNFSDFGQLRGIFAAAKNLNVPIILGTSEGESAYFGLEEAVALVDVLKKKTGVLAFLNLDHAKSFDIIKKAIEVGYNMVHFDGSALSFEENLKITKEIVKYGHKRGVVVEGEIGAIRGESKINETAPEIKEEDLATPEQAEKFIKETKVDVLAAAIGNIHGLYYKKPELDLKRLAEISKSSGALLVLHGGSGIPENEIREAIKLGVVKININTELRVAWKEGLKKELSLEESKPCKILSKIEFAVQEKVEEKIKIFNNKKYDTV
jgi:fructose-bisphosphate aldolase, class II